MTLNIDDYFKDLSDEIKVKSQAIRRDFKNHSTSSGEKGERISKSDPVPFLVSVIANSLRLKTIKI